MTLTGLTGTKYTLDPTPIGSGGEGDIYRVIGGDGAKVAKLSITRKFVGLGYTKLDRVLLNGYASQVVMCKF